MMEHQQAIDLVPAYVDEELGVADALALARHLDACAECRAALAQQSAVRARLRADASGFRAPAGLAQRIRAALPADSSGQHDIPTRPAPARPAGWLLRWNPAWARAGAMALCLLALAWSSYVYVALPSSRDLLASEVVSSHVRSLQVDHLSDVVSSDRHTVKPWFNGKLDFAPRVVDPAASGYPLVGGRLDYLGGRTVAALVYRHGPHPINLYTWPGPGPDAAPVHLERQGFRLVHWRTDGMAYWAVSDLAPEELDGFVAALRNG